MEKEERNARSQEGSTQHRKQESALESKSDYHGYKAASNISRQNQLHSSAELKVKQNDPAGPVSGGIYMTEERVKSGANKS